MEAGGRVVQQCICGNRSGISAIDPTSNVPGPSLEIHRRSILRSLDDRRAWYNMITIYSIPQSKRGGKGLQRRGDPQREGKRIDENDNSTISRERSACRRFLSQDVHDAPDEEPKQHGKGEVIVQSYSVHQSSCISKEERDSPKTSTASASPATSPHTSTSVSNERVLLGFGSRGSQVAGTDTGPVQVEARRPGTQLRSCSSPCTATRAQNTYCAHV